jgi:hypothetical protein
VGHDIIDPPRDDATIELRLVRQENLQGGHPDYYVYAGTQHVGRIYRHVLMSDRQHWFWGVNTVLHDSTIGRPMHGYADDLNDAKRKVREAFDAWLVWAQSIPSDDPKHPVAARQLAAAGSL